MIFSENQKERFKFWLTIAWVIAIILMGYNDFVCADIDETTIGIGYSQINDDVGLSITGETPFDFGPLKGEFTAQGQGDAGGEIRGKYGLEVRLPVPVGNWEINLVQNGTFRGYSISELGRTSDLGAELEFPEFNVGQFVVTSSLGLFGRNGGVFAGPNAYSDLEGLGYAPAALDAIPGLADLSRAPTGLSIKAGNSLNARIDAVFKHSSGFDFYVAGAPELAGAGIAAHQAFLGTKLNANGPFGSNFMAIVEFGFQHYDDGEGDTIERDFAVILGADYVFQ